MPTHGRGDDCRRHPRHVQVGPLLRSQVASSTKPTRRTPTRMQHRPMNRRNTRCNKKSHDLLLTGSPTSHRKPSTLPKGVRTHVANREPRCQQAMAATASERLRQQNECRDRIGTKQFSNTDTDYHSDSSRPHLLTARTRAGVIQCTHRRGVNRQRSDGHAPPSSELRHYTAYPEVGTEATWAQPLCREELS
jgi:hypothetical protein